MESLHDFPISSSERWTKLAGNLLLTAIAVYWSTQILQDTGGSEMPWTFLDNANLIFHEAGHFIFLPFGQFMNVLGGSLTQILIPILILCTFIFQKSWFSAGFSLFWLGESIVNASFYISDAQSQLLPLLGGDSSTHDWNWLLSEMNLLTSDKLIGNVVHTVGAIILCAGIIWMISTLYWSYVHSFTLTTEH